MYIFKVIVFAKNIKRFVALTHMVGSRQSNNGCLQTGDAESLESAPAMRPMPQ